MIIKVNCLFSAFEPYFQKYMIVKYKRKCLQKQRHACVWFNDDLKSKAFLSNTMTNIKKCLFCSRTLEKNAQIINPNCRWNPELIKIDLFLELDDGFGQVYTNLDKFKPIRGKMHKSY